MTIPAIPDMLSKFCFLLSFIAFGYGYFEYESASNKYTEISTRYFAIVDSITNLSFKDFSRIDTLSKIFNLLNAQHDSIHSNLRKDSSVSIAYLNKTKATIPKLQHLTDSMKLINDKLKDLLEH